MTPIDAIDAYEKGTLRRTVVGRVRLLQREGRTADLLTEVARPLAALAEYLSDQGRLAEASSVLEHAIHDGVSPALMAQAIAAHAIDSAGPAHTLTAELTVGPNGELRAGPPPPATDLGSALDLLNDLRDRLT